MLSVAPLKPPDEAAALLAAAAPQVEQAAPMVWSLVEQDDDMTGIPQIDKQALGEPFCTIGRLVLYRRETPIRQHFRATISWETLKLILNQTNFATMSWKKDDLKHWVLLYKGVLVEEVYDALHTVCHDRPRDVRR